ncbi:MAG: hypothetical protein H0X64_07970 [Gemmatimonadaceae bacterium]|nr:hypothetical protein [Gemmatimonadaceae bacterium]
MTHAHTPGAPAAIAVHRTHKHHHVSWGAVFAGFVIAVSLQMTLTILGAAIGLTALDGADSGRAFGIGAAIWAILVPLVTLYVGGMVAGRMSHLHSNGDALLHGALVWALSLLLAVWLLGSGASRILGSTLDFAGSAASGALAGAGAAISRSDVTPDAARQAAAERGITEDEARRQLQDAQQQAGQVADRVQGAAAGSAWAALLAIGLSLLAAVMGARSGVHSPELDHRTT